MKIKVSVQGDPDTKPFIKIFHYDASDKSIFLASAQQIKDNLLNNMRLNISQVLELFVAYVILSLNEGKTIDEIQSHIPKILLPHQVMIGVPESLRQMVFTIITNDADAEADNNNNNNTINANDNSHYNDHTNVISVTMPIHINEHLFHQQNPLSGGTL